MHDEDGGRDIPYFMLPGSREEKEEDGDLEELFEAGTGRNNGKGCGIRDTGYGIRDMGCGMLDAGYGINSS